MLKSTAINIIQTFSKEEMPKFGDFVSSPYFNKKAGVKKLYEEVKKYYPDLINKNLSKENLWTKLFPGKDYNYGVMKNLIHDFTKLAEEFITQQEYRSRELQQFENLYACLSKRKLHNISENKKAHLIKNYDDKGILKTGMTFDEFYGRLTKIYEIKLWDSTFKDQWENLDGYVTKMEDSFFTGMLIHLVNVNALARVCKQNDKSSENVMLSSDMVLGCFDDKDLLKIIDETGKRSKIKFVLLKSYYLAYKAYSNTDSSSHFYEFKNFVFENFSGMPYNYLKDMDTYLLNSISYLKDKSIDKKNEYYEMYQFRHRNNLVVERNNHLNSHQFIPWMFLFLDENKLTDLEEYISTYGKYLTDEDKDSSIKFGKVMVLFMNSEFHKALSVLSKINFKLSTLKIILRKITLMIYYELNDYEGFIMSFDSYKHFLGYGNWAKKEWIDFYIKKAKNFAGIIDKLFKLRESGNKIEIELCKKELEESGIDNKKWFLRKVEELKKPA